MQKRKYPTMQKYEMPQPFFAKGHAAAQYPQRDFVLTETTHYTLRFQKQIT